LVLEKPFGRKYGAAAGEALSLQLNELSPKKAPAGGVTDGATPGGEG
jgi:hypothetical protein